MLFQMFPNDQNVSSSMVDAGSTSRHMYHNSGVHTGQRCMAAMQETAVLTSNSLISVSRQISGTAAACSVLRRSLQAVAVSSRGSSASTMRFDKMFLGSSARRASAKRATGYRPASRARRSLSSPASGLTGCMNHAALPPLGTDIVRNWW